MAGTSSREPCPDRIIDDAGTGFAMGAIGGSAVHFIRGMYQSPKGYRRTGGLENVRMRTPNTAGGFAAWGGLYSGFDCTLVYLRQKEDPWNSILAGASTGGLLSMRNGFRSCLGGAVISAFFLAIIEGGLMMLSRFDVPQAQDPFNFPGMPMPPVEQEPVKESSGGGRGLFGWGRKKETSDGESDITEVLESFDTPVPPMSSFEYE